MVCCCKKKISNLRAQPAGNSSEAVTKNRGLLREDARSADFRERWRGAASVSNGRLWREGPSPRLLLHDPFGHDLGRVRGSGCVVAKQIMANHNIILAKQSWSWRRGFPSLLEINIMAKPGSWRSHLLNLIAKTSWRSNPGHGSGLMALRAAHRVGS